MFNYIDPQATTILVTSITSIVVALSATFILIWRKLKRGVKKTFHIDENAGKEVEDDLVINEELDKNEENKEESNDSINQL